MLAVFVQQSASAGENVELLGGEELSVGPLEEDSTPILQQAKDTHIYTQVHTHTHTIFNSQVLTLVATS